VSEKIISACKSQSEAIPKERGDVDSMLISPFDSKQ
jgi:hypothetical protein